MPSLQVAQAFDARMALWSSKAACPLVDLNSVSAVPKPPFIEIEYPVSIEERISTGRPAVYRERGGARFVITVAAFHDGWKSQVLGWVEELRDLFRSQYFDGVETGEASPAVLDDRNRAGNTYRIPFVVTFTHDVIR